MRFSRLRIALLLTSVIRATVFAQDDVVRINTELVQTTITVVDKKGKFVEGLNRGDFGQHADVRVHGVHDRQQTKQQTKQCNDCLC
jgi:hypothetical protein